jgi:RNA polymerase sigma-70 factor, ECF subfamily
MAAMDGNPGQKKPGKLDQRQRSDAPNSADADVPSDPATNQRQVRSGAGREENDATPSHRNKPASEPQEQDAFEHDGSQEDEQETRSAELGNILKEGELDEADHTRVTPESETIWEEEAQLSSDQSVRQDMGTIALERIPIDEQSARLAASHLPAGLAADLSQMSDAEIMQRAGAGDEACLEFLIAKYRRPIISFMYRMVHNQAVAEELAQEVFLRVYRARATYRAEARFSTWLYRIATNMAINHARDTKYERASSSVFLDQADEETGTRPDVPDLRPVAEQDMLQDERMRRIREHVMALPERQRMAVVMHKYQDMDYKQIGAVLKLSESATKSLLFRAYQTLREKLKEFA